MQLQAGDEGVWRKDSGMYDGPTNDLNNHN
jgi:hypothetical protein